MIEILTIFIFIWIVNWIGELMTSPPLPPYPDDGEDEGIYRPEDDEEQP
jgi:hypothetical protein